MKGFVDIRDSWSPVLDLEVKGRVKLPDGEMVVFPYFDNGTGKFSIYTIKLIKQFSFSIDTASGSKQ